MSDINCKGCTEGGYHTDECTFFPKQSVMDAKAKDIGFTPEFKVLDKNHKNKRGTVIPFWHSAVNSRDGLTKPPEEYEQAVAFDLAKEGAGDQYIWMFADGKWSDDSILFSSTSPCQIAVNNKLGITPEVALNLIRIRQALLAHDIDEAYHILYEIADKDYTSLAPWQLLEELAAKAK